MKKRNIRSEYTEREYNAIKELAKRMGRSMTQTQRQEVLKKLRKEDLI